jgi:hypothetical protein
LIKHRDYFTFRRQEVTGRQRILYNKELNNLHSTPIIISDQIQEDGMDGACRKHDMRNVYKNLVRKYYGKTPTNWEN